MSESKSRQRRSRLKNKHIPVELSEKDFNAFILPHLSTSTLGRKPKIPFLKLFNYIMYVAHTGCQWDALKKVIDKNKEGKCEIHYTNVFRWFKRWSNDKSWISVFNNTVMLLQQNNQLYLDILHGDGTSSMAKKGGDNIGYNGHKHFKGEKTVAICDRNCNVISPFTTAPGNRNESLLFADAFAFLNSTIKSIGASIKGSIMSLDGAYDSRANRKLIFNSKMTPNIPENKRNRKRAKPGPQRTYDENIFQERFRTIERVFAWEDKFKRVLIRFEHISKHYLGFKLLAYSMINLRHFVTS